MKIYFGTIGILVTVILVEMKLFTGTVIAETKINLFNQIPSSINNLYSADKNNSFLSIKSNNYEKKVPIYLAIMPQNTGSYAARVIQRDYDIHTSLPLTGETTIVKTIDRLKYGEMFAPCPENSQLIEFAESTNFLVQICLKETANDSTVFWMGSAKDGRGSLTLSIDENFEFWNFDTYYAIERRPLGENSYLLIGWPDGTLEAEALLYYYYPCFGDDC